jgi:hypothetical protein
MQNTAYAQERGMAPPGQNIVERASIRDATEILALQKLA